MLKEIKPALIMLLVLTMITGVVYPAVVTGIAKAFFPHQAQGSLVQVGDKLVGSQLIGQPFSDAKYFWSRPSATAPMPYNAASSAGSNLGPTNPALMDAVKARIAALKASDPAQTAAIPVDLVTTSASGLDPQISPAAAHDFHIEIAPARVHLDFPALLFQAVNDAPDKGHPFEDLLRPVFEVIEIIALL